MPVYIDTHENTTEFPPGLRDKVTERIRQGNEDDFGVIDRGILIDHEGNKMHCVLQAPDVDAIRRHHEALDVPLDEETVHEADVILKD